MNNRGFSLVELLVTVGIIGILSAVAVVSYENYRQNAWNARIASFARSLFQAQVAYQTDQNAYQDCEIDNGVSNCTSLPGIEGIDLTGYSSVMRGLSGGILIAACHTSAEFGIAYVTDPTHIYYTQGEFQTINLSGVGSCSVAEFGVP